MDTIKAKKHDDDHRAVSKNSESKREKPRAGVFKRLRGWIMFLAFAAMLALNVATLTVEPVFRLLSAAVASITQLVTQKPVTVNSRHIERVDSLNARNRKLNKDLGYQKRFNAALRHQIDAGERYIAALRRQVDVHRYVKFKGKKRLISEAVQETTERISRRVAVDTARNTGSMFAEAIPYVVGPEESGFMLSANAC